MKTVYLIGSLRNPEVPKIANILREATGFEVFDDWYAPGPNADDYWRDYEIGKGHSYKEALQGWAGKHIFEFDHFHVDRSDIGVIVAPAGKSGHLELGYMIGRGKPCFYLLEPQNERYDVMLQFCNLNGGSICSSMEELVQALKKLS